MSKKFATLYKYDSKGKLREWRMETDGSRFRTISGLADGKQVTTEWTVAEAKNVGRANATTAEEQAEAEVMALYKKRLDGEYSATPTQAEGGTHYVKPMLADKWEDRKDKLDYPVYVQPKLDGIRCIVTRKGMFSRTGKPIVAAPHIFDTIKPLFTQFPQLVLDGELYNHDLRDDFNKIVSLVRKTKPTTEDLVECRLAIQYHVYDMPSAQVPYDDSPDANREGFFIPGRLTSLKRLFDDHFDETGIAVIKFVPTQLANNEAEVDEAYGSYLEEGYEGGIVRAAQGRYANKRSKDLLKRKDFQDEEFEIVRIEEGNGNWSGVAKRVVIRLEDGREAAATLKGDRDYALQVLQEADQYIGKQATVQYFERTPDGVPRFPIAKILHKDKRW